MTSFIENQLTFHPIRTEPRIVYYPLIDRADSKQITQEES